MTKYPKDLRQTQKEEKYFSSFEGLTRYIYITHKHQNGPANPNTMTLMTVFSAEYQLSHFKASVYQILADTRLEPDLYQRSNNRRSWASDVVANDMGADGSYSTQAIADTQETLTVNKEKRSLNIY